ncbi:MAG: adenylate/guanylate cyclase domain-containing protein [Candidatus Dormibacteria bacterium]
MGAERLELAEAVVERIGDGGVGSEGERRWVTALFVDVSGFTSLAETVAPDELVEIIEPILSRVREVVNRYEGYVAKYLGDAVLAFFGAPLAHEDDAARAVMVALEVRREFERLLPTLASEQAAGLELHIGVNSGHVVSGFAGRDVRIDAYSIMGDAVNTAQRLEAAAPPGEVYVGDMTHDLTVDHFDYELVGNLTVKGKAQPVRTWRLVGERRQDEWRSPDGESRMVGRAEEVAACQRALDTLLTGRGGITTVVAEAGMGKSMLLRQLRQDAEGRGIAFLQARCVSYGNELAYWPYAELVRSLYGLRPEEPGEVTLQRLTEALVSRGLDQARDFFAVLIGLKAPEETGAEPEAVRRKVHESLALALRQRARTGPVVLALEDLHWVDEASLALTRDLLEACAEEAVHFVLTGRPEAWEQIEPLVEARPASRQTRLTLGNFGEESTAHLLEDVLGAPLAPTVAGFFQQRTLGNPFFSEELSRSMREAGHLVFHDGAWELAGTADTLALPPTVEGVIATRLDRLPRPDLAILQVAAVVGRRPRIPLLKGAAGHLDDIDQGIGRLVQTHFLTPAEDDPGEFLTFRHVLVQEVVYSRILRRHRREAHRRVADAAIRLYGDGDDFIDITAHHLYLAEAGEEAFRALVRAARKSRRLFANEEAIVHLQHALEIAVAVPSLDGEIAPTLLDIGRLQELTGAYDRALDSYGRVRDRTGQVEAWQGMAAVLRKRGEGEGALELIDAALDHARQTGQDVRPMWLERAWCLGALKSRYSDMKEALEEGLREDPGRADEVEGYLVVQLARVEAVMGRLEMALEHANRAELIFESLEDLLGLATVLHYRGGIENQMGDCENARSTLRRALVLAERVGAPDEIGGCLINLGMAEMGCGAIEEAIQCDRRAVEELERIGSSSRLATAHANLAEKLALAGHTEEALERSNEAILMAESLESSYTVADALLTRARLRQDGENRQDAEADARRAAQIFEAIGAPDRHGEALTVLERIQT